MLMTEKRILGSGVNPAIDFLGKADNNAMPVAVAAVFFKKFLRLENGCFIWLI